MRYLDTSSTVAASTYTTRTSTKGLDNRRGRGCLVIEVGGASSKTELQLARAKCTARGIVHVHVATK